MTNSFYPKIDFAGHIQNSIGKAELNPIPMGDFSSVIETPTTNFKGVMSGLTNNLNDTMNAPDKLLKASMAGDSDVDIHDVMTAMAKAEMSVSIATQVTSKVIQAYDKIMQISV